MKETKIYEVRVNWEQFGNLLDDYSESGYTNKSYSDIIIDLFNVWDREGFAETIGLPLDELPTTGLMVLYP